MRFSAQLRIAFLTICILMLMPFVVMKVHSQTANYLYPQTDSNVPRNLNTFTQGLLLNISDSLICQIAGVSVVNPNHQCLTTNPLTGVLGFAKPNSPNMPGGALGQVTTLIADTYSLPNPASDYSTYMASNFGFVKNKAYAANSSTTYGVGFAGISPLMNMWILFRNVVYLIYVIVFVVLGGAIMLRLKIDPRTVMTIENSLPKVIISLLLVTFSFAISGLLIDVMWIAVFLVINLISSVDPANSHNYIGINAGDATGRLFSNIFGYVNTVLNTGGPSGFLSLPYEASRSLQEVISNLLSPNNSTGLGLFPAGTANCLGKLGWDWIGCKIGSSIGTTVADVIGFLLSWAIGILAFLVILIAVLVSMLRLWLQLIQAYVIILLDIVTAPFWIMVGAFPGAKNGFELWLRDMMGWLMPFPIVIALFLVGKVFIDTFGSANISTLFVPPLIGNPNGQSSVTGGAISNPMGAIIGVSLILTAPQAVKIARDAFKSPNIPYIAGMFQSIGIGTKALGGVMKTVIGYATQEEVSYESGTPKTINGLGKLWKQIGRRHS